MKQLLVTLALSLFLLPACGASDPRALADEGSTALNSGDYQKAAGLYEKALAALGDDPSNPDWMRCKLGWVQAEARIDGGRAKDEFLKLAAANPSRVTDKEFNLVGSRLGDAGKLEEAIAVLKAGMEANPESVHLQALMKDLGDRAKSAGSAGALDSLKGLGYVGGD